MNLDNLREQFEKLYEGNNNEIRVYFSPGRVNLIGEHTDYNGGYVFPCALSYGTYLLASKNGSANVNFATTNFDFRYKANINNELIKVGGEWVNYPMGVIKELLNEKSQIEGLDLLFSGDIPNSSGLSSSASIELVLQLLLTTCLISD